MSTTGTHTQSRPPTGRDAELARIDDAVMAATTGRGTALFIEGPFGSGKSRLLEEAEVLAHRHQLVTVTIRCCRLARRRAFGPVVEALLASGVQDGPLEAEGAHDELLAIFARLAEARPLLVTVDAFEFADEGTQDVVFALERLTHRLPVVVITTATDWPAATVRLVETARHHLVLRPLDDDALIALARSTMGCPPGPRLTERLVSTGGNPFLALRLIDAFREEGRLLAGEVSDPTLPPRFCRVVQRLLSELSDGARGVLRAAAVLGCSVRIDRVAAVLDAPMSTLADAVDELQREGVLRDRGGEELVFAQPIVCEAIGRTINAAHRLDLRARAATSSNGPTIAGRWSCTTSSAIRPPSRTGSGSPWVTFGPWCAPAGSGTPNPWRARSVPWSMPRMPERSGRT